MKGQAGTVRRVVSTRMPTRWGVFQTIGFEREILTGSRRVETALAIVLGDLAVGAPLLRIHSQCFTGEVLGSLRCDCKDQLEIAMRAIAEEGRGLVIYEHQEGRGIGLMAKLQAYALQDEGLDTVEANHALGFRTDYRDFGLSAAILHELGISRVRLLSNNPDKSRALFDAGIEVVAQVPCEAEPNSFSLAYLRAKKEKMGHALSLGQHKSVRCAKHPGADEFDRYIEISDDASRDQLEFASIQVAIRELRAGRMIVVVDDEDRENEGDLAMARVPDLVRFCKKHNLVMITVAELARYRLELDYEGAIGAMDGIFPACLSHAALAAA